MEAWIVLFGWLLALVCGVFGGVAAADTVERSAEQVRAESHKVTAVLVKDARDPGPTQVTTDHLVWATVRWTDPEGVTRTDEARVPPHLKAGGTVVVWADRDGVLPKEPLSETEMMVHSVAGGILAGSGSACFVLGSAWVARLALERRRLEQWAAEWERVDSPWGWKTG